MVVRSTIGAGLSAAAQHSQCLYPILTHIPGLKVVVPSNAYDAKGLLIQAIRDDDPVIFLEHKLLYESEAEVPDESYTIPFGEAEFAREGEDVTIVAFSRMVNIAVDVADKLEGEGISVEVVDPRTTSPLDEEAILESVERTGRLVVVDESNPRCSMAADISALVAEKAFGALRAPIHRVTAPHSPVPFAPTLEAVYVPNAGRVEAVVREIMSESSQAAAE
jgi:pyruvate dehydrogenase E1 component beta subunit